MNKPTVGSIQIFDIDEENNSVNSRDWTEILANMGTTISVTSKESPNALKIAQNDVTIKMKDFDTFTKIA